MTPNSNPNLISSVSKIQILGPKCSILLKLIMGAAVRTPLHTDVKSNRKSSGCFQSFSKLWGLTPGYDKIEKKRILSKKDENAF